MYLFSQRTVVQKMRRRIAAGFTLIEMLVVIGIIVVISGIILANNARFGGAVQLENLAYDIALTIRQSQVYGISVQRFGTGSLTFAPAYGMHFAASSGNSYIMFGDVNSPANGIYDATCSCELVQQSTIQNGYGIVGLYVTPLTGAETSVSTLDITFRRPEPDAYISKNGDLLSFDANGKFQSGTINQQARILLQSPHGEKINILVYANGQISIQPYQPGAH